MVLSNGYTITKSINKEKINEVSSQQHDVTKMTKIYSRPLTSASTITALAITPTTEHLKHKSPKRKISDFWRKCKGKKNKTNESMKKGKNEEKRKNKDVKIKTEDRAPKDIKQRTVDKREHGWRHPINKKHNMSINSIAHHHANFRDKIKNNKRSLYLFHTLETPNFKRDIRNKSVTKKTKTVSSIRIGITPQAVAMTKPSAKKHPKVDKTKANDDIGTIISAISPQLANLKKKYKFNTFETIAAATAYEKLPPKSASTPNIDASSELEFLATAQIEDLLNNIKLKTIQMIAESNSPLGDMLINSVTEKYFTADPFLIQLPTTMPQQSLLKLVAINNGNKYGDKRKICKERAFDRSVSIYYDKPRRLFARSLKAQTAAMIHSAGENIQQKIKNIIKKMKAKVSKNQNIEKTTTKLVASKKQPKKSNKTNLIFKNTDTKSTTTATTSVNPTIVTKNKPKQPKNTRNSPRSLPTFDDTVMPLYEDMLEKEIALQKKTSKLPLKRRDKNHHRIIKRNTKTAVDLNDVTMYDEDTGDYLNPEDMISNDSLINSTSYPSDNTGYNILSNKLSYTDYVNGYKHYLQFQKDLGNDKFSAMVKYQAHRHHNVDDIGKYILNKIPTVHTSAYLKKLQRRKRFFDDTDIDDQEMSTKTDESWFKKHFYLFIDNGPPKKFHTSQTVSLKTPLTELPSLESNKSKKLQHGDNEHFYVQFGDDDTETSAKEDTNEPTLGDLSGSLDSRTPGILLNPSYHEAHSYGNTKTTTRKSATLDDVSNLTDDKTQQLNFISRFFRNHYRRTPSLEMRRNTLDSGNRIKRASHDESTSKAVTTYETVATTTLAKDIVSLANANTHHKGKDRYKCGYVDVNLLVPKGAAVVKLRENTSNKNKVKEFFKKFNFKDKTKDKSKRSCNPFKKLKDIFKPRMEVTKPIFPSDKNNRPNNFSGTISPQTKLTNSNEIKTSTLDMTMSIDDMKMQVPNISVDYPDSVSWTPTTPGLKPSKKEEAVLAKPSVVTSTDDIGWSSSTPLPVYKNDLESSQPESDLLKPKSEKMIFEPTSTTYNTPGMESSDAIFDNVSKLGSSIVSLLTVPTKDDTDSVTVIKTGEEPNGAEFPSATLENLPFNSVLTRYVAKKREKVAVKSTQAPVTKKMTRRDEKDKITDKTKVTRRVKPRIHFNLNKTHQLLSHRFSLDNDISDVVENAENVKYVPEVKYDDQQLEKEISEIDVNKLVSKVYTTSNETYKNPDYFNDLLNWHSDILNMDKVNSSWVSIVKQAHQDYMSESLATPSLRQLINEYKKLNVATDQNANISFVPTLTLTRMYDVNKSDKEDMINSIALKDKTLLKAKNFIIKGQADFFQYNRPIDTDLTKISNISQPGNEYLKLDSVPKNGYVNRLTNRDIPVAGDKHFVTRDWISKMVTITKITDSSSMASQERLSSNFGLPLVTVTVVTDRSNDLKNEIDIDWVSPSNFQLIKGVRRDNTKETQETTVASSPALMIDTALLSYDDEVENVAKGILVKESSRYTLKPWTAQMNYMVTKDSLMTKLNKQPPQHYTTPLPMSSKDFEKFLHDEGMDVKSVTEPLSKTSSKNLDNLKLTTKKDNVITLSNITKIDKHYKATPYITKPSHGKAGTKSSFSIVFKKRYLRSTNKSSTSDTLDDANRDRLKKNIKLFEKIIHTGDDYETSKNLNQVAQNISLAISNLHKKASELPVFDLSDLNKPDNSATRDVKKKFKENNYVNSEIANALLNYPLVNAYSGSAVHNHLLYNKNTKEGKPIIKTNMKFYKPTISLHTAAYPSVVHGRINHMQKNPSHHPKKVVISSHHYKYDISYHDGNDVNDNIHHKRNARSLLTLDRTHMRYPKVSERMHKAAKPFKTQHSGRRRMRWSLPRPVRNVIATEIPSSSGVSKVFVASETKTQSLAPRQKRLLEFLTNEFVKCARSTASNDFNTDKQKPESYKSCEDEGFVIKVSCDCTTTTIKKCEATKNVEPPWIMSMYTTGSNVDVKTSFAKDEIDDKLDNSQDILSNQNQFITTLKIESPESSKKSSSSEQDSTIEDTVITKNNAVTEITNTYTSENIHAKTTTNSRDMLKSDDSNNTNVENEYLTSNGGLKTLHNDYSYFRDKLYSNSNFNQFTNSLAVNRFDATVTDQFNNKRDIYSSTPMPKSPQITGIDSTRSSRFEPNTDEIQQINCNSKNNKQCEKKKYPEKNFIHDQNKKCSDNESLNAQKMTSTYDNLHLDKKRDLQNQEVFTAKDVAALEVIVDLMKNTLSYEDKDIATVFSNNLMLGQPLKTIHQSQDSTNSIQVHIAIPYDIQSGKKRSPLEPVRVRRVFSAKMLTPVDLEYQIHSFEGPPETTVAIPTTTTDDGLSPGMYLLIDKPNNGYALKPVKAKIDLSNVRYRQITPTELNHKVQATTRREEITEMGKVTLSKNLISAINKQLMDLYENYTTAHNSEKRIIRKRRACFADGFHFRRRPQKKKDKTKFEIDSRYRIRRVIDWHALKNYFGEDRVCNCKCEPNKPMCRACAASDAVMNELIFEFNNIEQYMKDHCTELQTYFWMNPSGGLRLRDAVHNIDRSLQDYYKRVKGKCHGKTCKAFGCNIDKREFIKSALVPKECDGNQIISNLAFLTDDLNRASRLSTCYCRKLGEEGEKMLHSINVCLYPKSFEKRSENRLTTKKKLIKTVYSLDNINVNIICNPDVQTTESYELTTTSTITHNSSTTTGSSIRSTTISSLNPSSHNNPTTTATSADTVTTSVPPAHHQILSSQKSQNQENIFEFTLDVENEKPKKRKGFKYLFPRRNRKERLFTYYTIDNNTTPKPLFKRDTYKQIDLPILSDADSAYWFDFLHSSTADEIISARDVRSQYSSLIESAIATSKKSGIKNVATTKDVAKLSDTIKTGTMKNQNNEVKKHSAQKTSNISNQTVHINGSKTSQNETDKQYLSDDISQLLRSFTTIQDIETMNRNSNRSTQFLKFTSKNSSKITDKEKSMVTKAMHKSTITNNHNLKNKTTLSKTPTEKKHQISSINTKTTILERKTKPSAPLTIEDMEKGVSVVYSSKVTGYSKDVTAKKHTKSSKKQTASHSKKSKANTHRSSVATVSKKHEILTSLSPTSENQKTPIITSSLTTPLTNHTKSIQNPTPGSGKVNSNILTDSATVTNFHNDKITTKKISRKIPKPCIFGHIKSVTLRFLGFTKHIADTKEIKQQHQANVAFTEKNSESETIPVNPSDSAALPTNKDPSIIVYNEYDNQRLGYTRAKNSDYKNLLLSIIQYESKKLNDEWQKIAYNSEVLSEDEDKGIFPKDPTVSPGLFKESDIKKSTERNSDELNEDIMENVKSMSDLDIAEPIENTLFDSNRSTKKPTGLLHMIASKMGMKIISKDNNIEKAAKPLYSEEAALVTKSMKVLDPEKNIISREASDSYRPNKFVCDLQSTYNHVTQLRNELTLKEFEAYVRNIPCYKYKRMHRSFFINHKTGGLKWDWIRNKRSMGHRVRRTDDDFTRDNDEEPKQYCDAFETFIRDGDGIYRSGQRKRRNADDNEAVDLKTLPPVNPTTNEVMFMLDDSIALECSLRGDLLPLELLERVSWEGERPDMLEQDNVQLDGANLLIGRAGPRNSGVYTCSVDDVAHRTVRVSVVTLPSIDVVFMPAYRLHRDCAYRDLKAIQDLAKEMSKEISCGNVCSIRIDEPMCQIDRVSNRSFIRSTTVLTMSPKARIRCSVQCRRDLHSSMVRLSISNVPALKNTNVVLSRDGVNETLTPCKAFGNPLITLTLRKKDSSSHKKYHKLSAISNPEEVHVMIVCDAGYYLMHNQNICAPCPSNTSSSTGENTCKPCPEGTTSHPGSRECHKHYRRHRRYDWWWYPGCGFVVAGAAVGGAFGACLLLALLVQLVSRGGRHHPTVTYNTHHNYATQKTSTVCGRMQYGTSRPLSPSRVILARFFKPSLTSSRATAVDSQETRFELWKERNIPPPLPPVDFDLETS